MNIITTKLDKVSVLVRFSESNGAEDNQVVINVEIGSRISFEQSFIIAPNVEKLAVDFNFGASDEGTIQNPVQALEDIIGRNVPDMRRNGIGFGVVFECEKPKPRVGIHRASLLS